jgi:hypothetical protein
MRARRVATTRYAILTAATPWLPAAAVAAFLAGAGVQPLRANAPAVEASAGRRVAAIAVEPTPEPRVPALNRVGIPALRMPPR